MTPVDDSSEQLEGFSAQVGAVAPDFELPSHRGEPVRLSSFRGRKHVVIAFHPLAFTPVCARQMEAYEADWPWFQTHDTHILGISVDSVPCKIEWAKSIGSVSYDLLSDFHPHGAVAERYGVARTDGISERAIFVVNKEGTIVFARVYDIPELPDSTDVRRAIEAVRTEPVTGSGP